MSILRFFDIGHLYPRFFYTKLANSWGLYCENCIDKLNKIKSIKSKREDFVFGLQAAFLLLCLLISPVGAVIDWKISSSSPAVGYTLKMQGMASPGENIKAEVSFEKKFQYKRADINTY